MFQVRAVDCYLIEGVRALYRIAMTILILYTQENASELMRAALLTAWAAYTVQHVFRVFHCRP